MRSARASVRYKIDLAKIGATVRAELAKKNEAKALANVGMASPNAQARRRETPSTKTTK